MQNQSTGGSSQGPQNPTPYPQGTPYTGPYPILALGQQRAFDKQRHLDKTGRKLTAKTCGMKRRTV